MPGPACVCADNRCRRAHVRGNCLLQTGVPRGPSCRAWRAKEDDDAVVLGHRHENVCVSCVYHKPCEGCGVVQACAWQVKAAFVSACEPGREFTWEERKICSRLVTPPFVHKPGLMHYRGPVVLRDLFTLGPHAEEETRGVV